MANVAMQNLSDMGAVSLTRRTIPRRRRREEDTSPFPLKLSLKAAPSRPRPYLGKYPKALFLLPTRGMYRSPLLLTGMSPQQKGLIIGMHARVFQQPLKATTEPNSESGSPSSATQSPVHQGYPNMDMHRPLRFRVGHVNQLRRELPCSLGTWNKRCTF